MSEIVLATLNARYPHASFGLRYLLANLGDLAEHARLMEFTISELPIEIVAAIVAQRPRIVGFGVYIWNVEETTRVVADLKRLRPDLTIVLGGPEVSYETEGQPIVELADYVITGEADLALEPLCQRILAEDPPADKVQAAPLPRFDELKLPYHLYDEHDIAHRVLYVEASRGCPYECEFCLSSLEIPVRQAPLEPFLASLDDLLARGALQFKFVDRTFNLNMRVSRAILEFFLKRYQPGMFLHFEMIPDRFPESLRELVARFPPGALQFEVGIQTFNPVVSAHISRRQDYDRLADNLRFLRSETGVHVHADLIVGLPGETLESFAAGFDRLVELDPQEIQVGMLKRLSGTPIIRHDAEFGMVYSPHPPYEILENRDLDFDTIQMLRRFARVWDLVVNSGHFVETAPLLWSDGSPFAGFGAFRDWLYEREGKTYAIALKKLTEYVFDYLKDELKHPAEDVADRLLRDYRRGGRRDCPAFLKPHITDDPLRKSSEPPATLPARQARHTQADVAK